jgi:hypothetical protein
MLVVVVVEHFKLVLTDQVVLEVVAQAEEAHRQGLLHILYLLTELLTQVEAVEAVDTTLMV